MTLRAVASGGGSGSGTFIGEVPTGSVNGSNTAFTLSQTPVAGTLMFQVNGIVLKNTVGYTISGVTVTTAAGYTPQTGDQLYANYSY